MGRYEGLIALLRLIDENWDIHPCSEAATAISTLEAEIAELVEGLRPFAALADVILAEAPAIADDIAVFTDCTGRMHKITMDQLRAVSSLLSKHEEDRS